VPNFTVHVAAGITYDSKGVFMFYNDPKEPTEPKPPRRNRPRRSKYETDEQFAARIAAFEKEASEIQVEIQPKGNSMTQKFYAEVVLLKHLEELERLKQRHGQKFWFQEDNDPSHGTRSKNNVPKRLKDASHVLILVHPAQSPDLNPIEGIWLIIKERLRGGQWQTIEAFKQAILDAWRGISLSQIRRRIGEMPWRCDRVVKEEGRRIKSDLW
jgi:hypothetical protein